MKTTYGWVGGNGTNTSVFSGLPGGLCGYFDGIFDYAGLEGYWWSSSPFSSDAWYRGLDFYIENVYRNGDGICDDVDTCVGDLDECGVCNGPGPTEVVIEDITILYDSVSEG